MDDPLHLKSEGGVWFQGVYHRALGGSVLSASDKLLVENFDNGAVQVNIEDHCTWKCNILPVDLLEGQALNIQAEGENGLTGSFLRILGTGSNNELHSSEGIVTVNYYLNNQLAGTEEVIANLGEAVLSFPGSLTTLYFTVSSSGEETLAFNVLEPTGFERDSNQILADKVSLTWEATLNPAGAAWINVTGDGIEALQIYSVNIYNDFCGDIVEIDEKVFF